MKKLHPLLSWPLLTISLSAIMLYAISNVPPLFQLSLPFEVQAKLCLYTTPDGKLAQVNSPDQIPEALRQSSKCFDATPTFEPVNEKAPVEVARRSRSATPPPSSSARRDGNYLAAPEEITLQGNIRREYLSSPIGNIDLRWPRKVESLFGRTPSKAMVDAARTVSRTLSRGAFPPELQRLNLEWKVVFMDADLPETQIPAQLISNCHPGWMTPPSNIYIVAQRVVSGCTDKKVQTSVADSQLAEILVHEIAHAVEAQLLQERFGGDRMRSEGWATWFTEFAASNSSLLRRQSVIDQHSSWAKRAIEQSPWGFQFSGSAEDYARAAMYFRTIVDERGLTTLLEIYGLMRQSGLSFKEAIKKRTGWDEEQLQKEVLKTLKMKR